MYELRILSGLHRGATLPLDDHPHVLGASDDADVVLVDPGVETNHATLSLTDSGWLLTALDGNILPADTNQSQAVLDLTPGDFARLGTIWLTVVEQDSPWENPPAEPLDALSDVMGAEDMAAEDLEPLAAMEETAIAEPAAESETAEVEESASEKTAAKAGEGRRGRRLIFIPMAIGAVLSAAAAYAITSNPEPSSAFKKIDIQAQIGTQSTSHKGKTNWSTAEATPAPTKALSSSELRSAFRKRLAEADLLKRFDLSLEDQSWSMKAALDDEEAARFERVLTAFITANNITFPVHAQVGNAESMLPFKIRQVITGANASVVTQDGDRLYVGDEYRGVKLAAIHDNRLTFTGKRKIEVKW